MSALSILGFLTAVLAFECAGLLAVRLTNPRLLGIDWLGGAFAFGAMGTALLVLKHHVPVLVTVEVADVLVLFSFLLLHIAVLKLIERAPFPHMSLVLLFIQAAFDLFVIYGMHATPHWLRVRVAVAGLLIAAQTGMTARCLMRHVRIGMRAPVWFMAVLLALFDLLLFIRGTIIIGWLLDDPDGFRKIEGVTFLLYIPFTLGFSFGFFWITTAKLTAGLDELASTDPLTRLYNRRSLLALCQHESSRAASAGDPFSILLVDLDHFKSINDRYGHATGDDVLCAAAEALHTSVRSGDRTGRWGGEEFAALLPGASAETALAVAERVRTQIERIAIPWNGQELPQGSTGVRVTASIGVATWNGSGDTIEPMLARADEALYRAKQAGRNRVIPDPADGMEELALPTDCLPV